MKFVIDRRQLLNALQQVGVAVDRANKNSILQGILIVANSMGIRFVGTDYRISIQSFVSKQEGVEITSLGSVVIKASLLIDTIKKMPDVPINWTCKDYKLQLTAGGKKVDIVGESAEFFTTFKPEPGESISIDWETFRKMFSQVYYAASRKLTETTITGVKTETREGKLILTATDRVRLARAAQDVDFNMDKSVVIAADHLHKIKDLFEDGAKVKLTLSERLAVFESEDGLTAILHLIAEQYPNTDRLLAIDRTTMISVNYAELCNSLSLALLTSDKQIISLQASESGLEIVSEQDGNRTEGTIPLIKFSGQPIKVNVNGKYLLEAIKAVDWDVCISFMGNQKPLVISDGDEEFAAHLLSYVLR